MRVSQDYVNIGSTEEPQLVHFRRAGDGPPLLMLHPSPLSSAALLPLIGIAAEFCTVVAPDTPGYGWSDPLPAAPPESTAGPAAEPATSLAAYVGALDSFTRGLGLGNFGLYGSATGAQIAIEFSKAHADRVDYLVLDNAAHFTDAERERITAGYFPDLAPDVTGSHLVRAWSMARDQCLFFPWHQATPATRLPAGGVDAGAVQQLVMDFLLAGKSYPRAYRAAFANEKIARVLPLRVPVVVMRWQGSILKTYTDRFDSVAWPDNFTMLHCGPTREQRNEAFRSIFTGRADQAVTQAMTRARGGDCRTRPAVKPARPGRGFLDLEQGPCHYLAAGDEQLPPLLALHDVGSSRRALAGRVADLAGKYQVIAPDLPGHGLSYRPQGGAGDIAGIVEALVELVKALDWPRLQILAERDSAAIAVQLAARLGTAVQATRLVNPLDYQALSAEWKPAGFYPGFAPDSEGTHLLKTWHWLRDRQLFWPWHARDAAHALPGTPRLDAGYLTARVTDFWLAQPVALGLLRESAACPLAERLDALDCELYLHRTGTDPVAVLSRRSLPTRNEAPA